MTMTQCPVCEKQLTDPLPPFCDQCGWDLKPVISIDDFPQSIIDEYRQRLATAQRNWSEKLDLEKKLREFQERLAQSENDQKSVEENRKTRERAVNTDRVHPGYSTETPVPELTQDPFETVVEFSERIGEHPPVHSGNGKLIKEKYDIKTGFFPLEIAWKDWVENLDGGIGSSKPFHVVVEQKFHVVAERAIARDMYESGPTHPVFGKLKVEDGRLVIDTVELVAGDIVLEIAENVVLENVKEWIEPLTGMEFVYVPGGTFMMGDVFEDGRDNEKPVHEVTLDDFYIGKFPVTQGQWEKVMGNNPSRYKMGDNYPVENVSWHDAMSFIEKLQDMKDHEFKLDLPTEAQWEYAARSGGKKEKYAGGKNLEALGWYYDNSGKSTHPVGRKKPNGLGLYDMSGNVWEWCRDWYDDYPRGAVENPVGPDNGPGRVLRGGGWYDSARNCRSADRNWLTADIRYAHGGFRLVLPAGQR